MSPDKSSEQKDETAAVDSDTHDDHGDDGAHSHAGTENRSHGSGHGHSHGDARKISRQRLLFVLGLTGTFMIAEAIAGFITGSLSLIADAGHMLGDVAALLLALIASWLASKPATPSRTFGYHRSEILAALANSVMLVVISIFVFGEALSRIQHPPEIQSLPMLIVAALGLCVNLVSMRLLTEGADKSLNARAAYLEVFSDMIASIGVILAAIVIMTTGWYIADPILSATLAVFILWRTWGLLKESIEILMESAPEHLNLEQMSADILALPGVVAVHDIHVWTITSGMISMSAHVTISEGTNSGATLSALKKLLDHEYGITHTTIQVESENEQGRCNDNCATL